MEKASITRRLMAVVIASQLALSLGLVIVGTMFSRIYLRQAFDVNLEGRAMSVAALVYYPDDGSPGLLFDGSKVPPSVDAKTPDLFWVQSDHHDFEEQSPGVDPKIFQGAPNAGRYWEFDHDGQRYRAIVLRGVRILDTEAGVPEPLPKLTVVYASPTAPISHRLAALGFSIALGSLLLLAPVLYITVRMVRRRLLPLKALARSAEPVSVANWRFDPPQEARDTEELRPLVSAIESALGGLHRSFDRQREFLSDAAHELKTAHAVLKSSLQLTLSRARTAEEYRSALKGIGEDSERLEDLLNRMLRLSKLEQWSAEGSAREFEVCDVVASCELAAARISTFAQAKKVEIVLHKPSQPMGARADAYDLEMVWVNLLENAVQYSPEGSRVDVTMREVAGFAIVEVADRGCGISAEDLPFIFERFRRGDRSRSRATGGVGLGLAMARSAVEAFSGNIAARSVPGQGTKLEVHLPLAAQAAAPTDTAKQQPLSLH